eukprot:8649341-Alexandrium_andersonii.AAC.1
MQYPWCGKALLSSPRCGIRAGRQTARLSGLLSERCCLGTLDPSDHLDKVSAGAGTFEAAGAERPPCSRTKRV